MYKGLLTNIQAATGLQEMRIYILWPHTDWTPVWKNLNDNSNSNSIYLLQLGFHPVVVVILYVNKTWNWLLLNLSREGYMRSM